MGCHTPFLALLSPWGAKTQPKPGPMAGSQTHLGEGAIPSHAPPLPRPAITKWLMPHFAQWGPSHKVTLGPGRCAARLVRKSFKVLNLSRMRPATPPPTNHLDAWLGHQVIACANPLPGPHVAAPPPPPPCPAKIKSSKNTVRTDTLFGTKIIRYPNPVPHESRPKKIRSEREYSFDTTFIGHGRGGGGGGAVRRSLQLTKRGGADPLRTINQPEPLVLAQQGDYGLDQRAGLGPHSSRVGVANGNADAHCLLYPGTLMKGVDWRWLPCHMRICHTREERGCAGQQHAHACTRKGVFLNIPCRIGATLTRGATDKGRGRKWLHVSCRMTATPILSS